MAWRSWRNAEIYAAFARDHSIYRTLNEHLVDLADLENARRILDLACGTGSTAAACLAAMPPEASLVGVDASEAMVGVARARTIDPRARFEVTPAADIGRMSLGSFDRCLCNAAIWQFSSVPTAFASVARSLEPGALFAFNIPAERLGEPSPIHPFQVALARAIEARSGERLHAPRTLDAEAVEPWLSAAGFRLEYRDRFTWRGRQGELMKLMEIPAMIEPMTPGLDDTDRTAILREAGQASDPREIVLVPWIFFVARRIGENGARGE